ncbi:hypothetical protein LTR53_006806 [Teratosphaeriaceae sp. CCFEE 6253]|nr:hypothetical protein LTR53_006806 [Teratosphaeriaceae sp. CCFEE 6253]
MVCPTCQAVFEGERILNVQGEGTSIPPPSPEIWSSTALWSLAAEDCCICRTVRRNITSPSRKESARLSYQWRINDPDCLVLSLTLIWDNQDVEREFVSCKFLNFHLQSFGAEEAARERQHSSFASKPLEEYTGPKLREWLGHCNSSHADCRTTRRWRPSRLLRIESTPDQASYIVKLRTFHVQRKRAASYAALSYRWGGGENFKLLLSNIETLRFGVDSAALPATIRDAATIAVSLGLSYLWIDSLCIVQDSPSDWAQQATQMHLVYENAECTIAVTRACELSEHFLTTCKGPSTPSLVHTRWNGVSPQSYHIFDQDLWERNVDQAAFYSRGWTLQERLLSRRVIDFAEEDVFWHCRQTTAYTACPIGRPQINFRQHDVDPEFVGPFLAALTTHGPSDMYGAGALWKAIVETYSKCTLTYDADKLVAIAGLAQRLQSWTKDEYFAGLWKQDLLLQLLWRPIGGAQRRSSQSYIAPSWSWASIVGGIVFDHRYGSGILDTLRPASPGSIHEGLLACVLDIRIQPVSKTVFGQISRGALRLKGRLIPATFALPSQTPQQPDETHHVLRGPVFDRGGVYGIDFDLPRAAGEQQVSLLPLYRERYVIKARLIASGLILEPVPDKKDSYMRIGTFWTRDDTDRAYPYYRPCLALQDSSKEKVGYGELCIL